jgi:hypothetical protein
MQEEIETELDGIRLRSTIEIVEEEPGLLTVSIEGPVIEFDDDEGI